MEKTLALLNIKSGNTYQCLETGETNTINEWAKAIAETLGSRKSSVELHLYRCIKNGAKAYGLTFTKVNLLPTKT